MSFVNKLSLLGTSQLSELSRGDEGGVLSVKDVALAASTAEKLANRSSGSFETAGISN